MGPGSDDNEQVLHIPASLLFSVISRTLIGGGYYPSAEKQSVYSTAPADRAKPGRSSNSLSTISQYEIVATNAMRTINHFTGRIISLWIYF